MNSEMELFGRMLAFFELTTEELRSFRTDLKDVRDTVERGDAGEAERALNHCIDRVRWIQKQCANVLGNLPCPAPLQTGKEV